MTNLPGRWLGCWCQPREARHAHRCQVVPTTAAVSGEGRKSTMLHGEDEDVHGSTPEYRRDPMTDDR